MSNILTEMTKLLELYTTFTRPDSSGIRMGFTGKPGGKNNLSMGNEYPYDGNSESNYGQPMAMGRSDSGSGRSYRPLVARAAKHNPWDEANEIAGYPTFISKSSNSQIGAATGIPGASGQWANNPLKPWDRSEYDEGSQSMDGFTTDNFSSIIPDTKSHEVLEPHSWHDQTDGEIERKLDRIWGRDSNKSMSAEDDIDITNGEDMTKYTRYDIFPKRSAWVYVINVFKK